jgi:endonuclease YncB( thermonuclease family)
VDGVKRSSAGVSARSVSPRRISGAVHVAVAALAAACLSVGGHISAASVLQSLRSAPSKAHTFRAKVAAVVDGDTLHVTDVAGASFNIRLEGIDCPESGQPFGGVALRFTRAAAFDRDVEVRVVDKDWRGRLVARVFVDGEDLSLKLLRAGLAWHYTDYSHDTVLASAERDARQAKRGLWSEASAVPPWVWRREATARAASRGIDDQAGPFVANTSSRVFHAANCRNAHCQNCTVTFATTKAAIDAGYRPAGDCLR